MFGIDLIAALSWGQILALVVLVSVFVVSLCTEDTIASVLLSVLFTITSWSLIGPTILSLSLIHILTFLLIYAGIGFIWSLIKYRSEVRRIVLMLKFETFRIVNTSFDKAVRKEIKTQINAGRVLFWVIYWPVSMISYLCTRLLKNIWKYLIRSSKRLVFIYDEILIRTINNYK